MMTGRVGTTDAGGPARHIPVLLVEVLEALDPKPGETVIDGTFGAGGYTRAIIERGADVVAIDRDPEAFEAARRLAAGESRLTALSGRFGDLAELVAEPVDGIVLDIGVSSMQIDEAERGFSFQKDGPLDMRMGGEGPTAADVVNSFKAGDLARVLGFYGEERQAGRIARAIEARRQERPFLRTLDLADTVAKVVGRSPKARIDPATRTFQALRIFVNDELSELARALLAAEQRLRPGGRIVVVTFHSLEDRIVKRFLRERSQAPSASRHMPDVAGPAPTFAATNKAISAQEAEAAANPRARSAKLRSATRTDAPVPDARDPLSFAALPRLANLPSTGA